MLKKNIKSLLLSCGLFILFIFILFGILSQFQPDTPADTQTESVLEYHYVLKEYQGKIAVYSTQDEQPKQIFDIYLNTLPDSDVQRLKEGIPIQSEEQLEEYIQDFDS
jgi:hypothetical protein